MLIKINLSKCWTYIHFKLDWALDEKINGKEERILEVKHVTEGIIQLTLSTRIPATKEMKKVEPMAREPTREHLKAASGSPWASCLSLSFTNRIPNVLMIPNTIPFTRNAHTITSQAWNIFRPKYLFSQWWKMLTLNPPSGGSAALVSFLFAIISISWKYIIDETNGRMIPT